MKKNYHFPEELYYDGVNHMWVRKNQNNAAVDVGLDAIGLDILGELAYITLRPVGEYVKKGGSMGALEAAKMTGDLIAPVSGTICEINGAVVQNPGIVNNDLYHTGWMVAIDPDNWDTESQELVSGTQIKPWIEAEVKRMETQGLDV